MPGSSTARAFTFFSKTAMAAATGFAVSVLIVVTLSSLTYKAGGRFWSRGKNFLGGKLQHFPFEELVGGDAVRLENREAALLRQNKACEPGRPKVLRTCCRR